MSMFRAKNGFNFSIATGVLCLIMSDVVLAQSLCPQVFQDKINSVIKSPTTPLNTEWVKEQRSRVVKYIRGTSQYRIIQGLIRFDNRAEENMIRPLVTPEFTIKIIDEGLAPRKAVNVVLVRKGSDKKEILLSSLKHLPDTPTISKYKNNNTVVPVDAQLSPLKDYLLVRIAAKGSLDVFTLVVIRLKDKKILSEIENVSTQDTVWIKPNKFSYAERGIKRDAIIVEIDDQGQVTTRIKKNFRIYGSDDQLWAYEISSTGEYSFFSTVKAKKRFKIITDRIENVFKTSNDLNTLWIQTEGRNGFKEILKVMATTNQEGVTTTEVKKIVPESDMVIDEIKVTGTENYLVVPKYLGARRVVEIRNFDGVLLKSLEIPSCCEYKYKDVKYNDQTQDIEITLQSPAKDWTPWTYDTITKEWFLSDKKNENLKQPNESMMNTIEGEFLTEYKSYLSKDGTEIPIRITYRKGTVFNSNAPVLMEGYGGFGSNSDFHPSYDFMTYEFIKAGGVHLAPAIRGSYFFGQKWHDQGRTKNKQNVIDDFIAAAEWAIQAKVTQPKRIAISGASHGGLLVGAAITQRPDLFGLAFPQYGPLAFHDKPMLDPFTTPYQVYEYGNLISDPAAQALAKKISPELNIDRDEYPMTVIITGRNDSRVNPQHSYRFAEKLINNQAGDQPIYLYTNSNSGHWMGSINRQDFLGWRTTSDYWAIIFDYFKLKIVR